MRFILTGKRFGKLTVTGYSGKKSSGVTLWNCLCDCGNTAIVRSDHLKNGNTKSCGCLQIERVISVNTKHGLLGHTPRLYRIWSNMKQRCNNPKNIAYQRYGGRGIKICDDWSDYKSFFNWSINNGYYDDLSIDRINNDKGYSPENCRWATAKEQANNRAKNREV